MITKEQENFIRQFVKKETFDTEKVISYLQLHDIVGEEIFEIAQKEGNYYGRLVTRGYGYYPINTEIFVRRVPFYFYTPNYDKDKFGDLSDIIRTIDGIHSYRIEDNKLLDDLYTALEKMFYIRGMSIPDIMNYAHKIGETDYDGGFFFKWAHYLDLCDKLHIDNKYPKNFLFETNKVLELAGENADIFDTGYVGFNEPYIRNGNEIIVGGELPYDENNQAALQWIGVWIENAAYVKVCNAYGMTSDPKFLEKELHIGLTPMTKIYLPYMTDDGKVNWDPIYFGPLVMDFDNSTLKKYRKRAELTQQNVADSIGVQLRTYQKWEKGEVKPDGYNLIRLMNYLNIESVQDFLKNTSIIDDVNYTKFRRRKQYN
ncbi:MAG: helix-turn-helix domain-containing protein [Roseburia sp.]|nr:helix-turn-helix domain-containing protein [Roseburia sp.]